MNVTIISFFKSSNLGDCVLSNCLYSSINNFVREKNEKIMKISYALNPFEYTDVNNINHIKLNKNSSLKSKIMDFLSYLKLHRFIYFYYKHKKYFSREDRLRVEKIISDTDVVVIGGGNMLFDLNVTSISAYRLKMFVQIAKKYNKPVMVTSIGMGPFKNKFQKTEAVKILEEVDYVTFRDKGSFDLYHSITKRNNAYITSDPAYLLPNSNNLRILKENIGINIIDPSLFSNSQLDREKIKKNYIQLIQALCNLDYKVELFTTELRDYYFMQELYSCTKNDKVSCTNINGLQELCALYHRSYYIISSRMHSLILALTQGTPIIALVWQEKVQNQLVMLKMTEYGHDIYNFSVDKILRQISSVDNYSQIINSIDDKVNHMKELFDINFELLSELLKKNGDKHD